MLLSRNHCNGACPSPSITHSGERAKHFTKKKKKQTQVFSLQWKIEDFTSLIQTTIIHQVAGLQHFFKTVRMEATDYLQVGGLKDCAVSKTPMTGFILLSLAKTDQKFFVLAGLFNSMPQNHSNLM